MIFMILIDKYASFQGYLSMECPGSFVFVHYIRLFTKYEHALILNMAAMVFQVADNNAVKNVGDLLPDAPFGSTDGTDALQQFPEVVFLEKSFALFQPFVIQSKAFDHIFFEDLRRPDVKLCGAPGIDPVTDGDDGVKVVDFCLLLLSFPGIAPCGVVISKLERTTSS